MADENSNSFNWNSALDSSPGILSGIADIWRAEKGISNAPVTYVQTSSPIAGTSNNMLLYGGIAIVVLVVLIVALKK
jgi:hypothetical protein